MASAVGTPCADARQLDNSPPDRKAQASGFAAQQAFEGWGGLNGNRTAHVAGEEDPLERLSWMWAGQVGVATFYPHDQAVIQQEIERPIDGRGRDVLPQRSFELPHQRISPGRMSRMLPEHFEQTSTQAGELNSTPFAQCGGPGHAGVDRASIPWIHCPLRFQCKSRCARPGRMLDPCPVADLESYVIT